MYGDKRVFGEVATTLCWPSHCRSGSPRVRTGREERDGRAVDDVDALPFHADDTSDAISKKPVGECASFPLTRRHIEREAICGVWFSHPPPSTYGKLWRLGGGDEGSKTVTGLGERGDSAIVKAKRFDGTELSV